MTPLADRHARLLDATYRAFGVAAVWSPVGGGADLTPVVRRQDGDGIVHWGESQALAAIQVLRVRRSEAPTPAEGDQVVVGSDTFRLIAEPRLETLGLEWLCEAARV